MKKSDTPNNDRMEEGALLITGCPRSATRSVTKYFENHGVSLGHETAGEKGTVDYRHAYTEFDEENPAFIIQMTLIRNPIDTIRSLMELLEGCDRKSQTWKDISELAVVGGWAPELIKGNFLAAATRWWTTVYERLLKFPVLKMEHLPKLPLGHPNRRVDRELDVRTLLRGNSDLWRVASYYGYYSDDVDA